MAVLARGAIINPHYYLFLDLADNLAVEIVYSYWQNNDPDTNPAK